MVERPVRASTRRRVIKESKLEVLPSHTRDLGVVWVHETSCMKCRSELIGIGRTEESARVTEGHCDGPTISVAPYRAIAEIDMKTEILRWRRLGEGDLPEGPHRYAPWQLGGIDPAEAVG